MAETTQLPPLILHPFGGSSSTDELVSGSRASLALQGFVDSTEDEATLRRYFYTGRYHEIRMLLFLGKDIFRWLDQCVEHLRRSEPADTRVTEQSFAAFLVEDPPEAVRTKL